MLTVDVASEAPGIPIIRVGVPIHSPAKWSVREQDETEIRAPSTARAPKKEAVESFMRQKEKVLILIQPFNTHSAHMVHLSGRCDRGSADAIASEDFSITSASSCRPVSADTSIGLCIVRFIVPQCGNIAPLRITRYAPSIVIGTTGSANSVASLNAPRRNACILPSRLREPSGKTTTDMPPESCFSAAAIVCAVAEGVELSTNIWPDTRQL